MQNDFNGSRLENGAPCRSKILHGRIIIIIVAILEGRVILALRLPCCHLLRCHHGRVGHHGGVGSFVCVSVFLVSLTRAWQQESEREIGSARTFSRFRGSVRRLRRRPFSRFRGSVRRLRRRPFSRFRRKRGFAAKTANFPWKSACLRHTCTKKLTRSQSSLRYDHSVFIRL